MSAAADWLRAEGREIEEGRRIWVQVSLSPGLFLAVLEVGPHGSGRSTFYGKADTPERAILVALEAEQRLGPLTGGRRHGKIRRRGA